MQISRVEQRDYWLYSDVVRPCMCTRVRVCGVVLQEQASALVSCENNKKKVNVSGQSEIASLVVAVVERVSPEISTTYE